MAKFTEEALTILDARYLKRDKEGVVVETPDDMITRVVNTISNAEHLDDVKVWAESFYKLLDTLNFLPNSPTLMNAGRDLGQLSGCFVIPIEDDISAIFEAVKQSAIIHKSGGGTGFSFSRLRPKGSIVKSTNGVASGPISFMKCFDTVTEVIKQGGVRRGANLGVLIDSHPDVRSWVECKRDKKSFSNFNISVALTDEFMEAVRKDGKYPLLDPSKKRIYVEEINARELFDYICECAWYSGEPGIIFIDTINKANPTPWLGRIESTNPCVVGYTLILTECGYVKIRDVEGKIVKIWNGEDWSDVEIRETGQDQEILDIYFSDGSNLSCTPYHKFYLNDGNCKEAKDLQIGDKLEKCKFPVIESKSIVDEKLAYTAGFYSGDGSESEGIYSIYVYGEKQNLLDKMIYKSSAACEGDRTVITLSSEYIWDKEFVPDAYWSIKTRMTWLSGLIDSDGGINSKEGSISITSVNKPFLMNVKRMLNTVGVNPTVSIMKEEGYQFMPDGKGGKKEYYCETAFRLIIPASAVNGLIEKGLKTHRVKLTQSTHKTSPRYIYVSQITASDKKAAKVYCFTEPKRGRGIFNGIMTGQCGEQPLLPWESCNLGSINISNFIHKKDIDYKQLGKTIETSVRFLDDVIDVNRYPKLRIARKTKLTRKIGLGIMGWADALLLMGIKYDSPEALIKAEELMCFLQKTSHEVSRQIAKEKGVFPAARKIKSRNAATTTLAPTGTISMIAGCSSGIEPIFSKSFTKTALDGKVLDLTSKFSDSPALITAHEISAENHIRMQAAFQKYTDNAVSKTINLPESATVEDVKNAILLAYDLKCKGFTVYREGTRDAPLQITTEAVNGEHKEVELRECNSGRYSLI